MKTEYLLKTLLLWMVICLPAWAGAEDLGFLRLSQMEGNVQIQSKGMNEWLPAAINLPVQNGDRLWVPKDAWAQVETREGNVIRIDADSSLEILAVDETSLQMYLSEGQAYLNFEGMDDTMLQLDTPVSSVRIYDSSTLNVALAENGNTEISVFRGAAYAENRSGAVRVGAGKMLSMDDGLPSLMALDPPNDWESWNKEWDESLAEDEGSEQYLPPELSGYGPALNRNGRWVDTREYGYVWTPTMDISDDWAPYRQGRWVWIGDDYVWIASEPWGWAPYHYGRWSYISSHGWCWVPPPRNEVYWGPGYVSWVSTETDVAWVPLAPGETYYGHGNYGPHSSNIVDVNIYAVIPGRNYRNVHVRNAVSVVHRDAFLRGQYRDMGHRENPFLRERINIGRPRLEPERMTRMPIIKDIPREYQPPMHIRSMAGRRGDGERHMVRERDRSVFRPTDAPRSLVPTIRESHDRAGKQSEGQAPAPSGQQQTPEHSVMPGQFGGRPSSNREGAQDVMRPARVKREPGAPTIIPVPTRVQQVPGVDEKNASVFRGRPQMPEQGRMPGQQRDRSAIDSEKIRPENPPVQVEPQLAPPPAPSREQAAPEVREERPALFRGRPQIPEQGRMPGQFRGRPTIRPEAIRSENPPVQVQPQAVPPPAPARVQAVPEAKEEQPAMFRGRPQMPEQVRMPGQFRGRPSIDPENIRSGAAPVQVQPQVAQPPAPAPAAKQAAQPPDAEELKRLRKEQAADKKDEKQDEKDKMQEMLQQRGMRPRFR